MLKSAFPFWFLIITKFHKTKTLRVLFTSIVAFGFYTWLIIYLENAVGIEFKPGPAIFSLLGIILGLLLVFRTNTAYERWWEGRKLLGALVNSSRNLAIKLNSLIDPNDIETRRFFANHISNYALALKEHLRSGVILEELEELTETQLQQYAGLKHVPNRIAGEIVDKVNKLNKEGIINTPQYISIDKQTEAYTDIIGGCERIKKTPIPISYSMHLKKFIFFYLIMMPFGFIHDLAYWTIPVMMLIFYAFVGLEVIGEEIEDPFGTDSNDLPLDEICRGIRNSVREILLPN